MRGERPAVRRQEEWWGGEAHVSDAPSGRDTPCENQGFRGRRSTTRPSLVYVMESSVRTRTMKPCRRGSRHVRRRRRAEECSHGTSPRDGKARPRSPKQARGARGRERESEYDRSQLAASMRPGVWMDDVSPGCRNLPVPQIEALLQRESCTPARTPRAPAPGGDTASPCG